MNNDNWEIEEEIGLEGIVKLAWCKLCEDHVIRTQSVDILKFRMEYHEMEHEKAESDFDAKRKEGLICV